MRLPKSLTRQNSAPYTGTGHYFVALRFLSVDSCLLKSGPFRILPALTLPDLILPALILNARVPTRVPTRVVARTVARGLHA